MLGFGAYKPRVYLGQFGGTGNLKLQFLLNWGCLPPQTLMRDLEFEPPISWSGLGLTPYFFSLQFSCWGKFLLGNLFSGPGSQRLSPPMPSALTPSGFVEKAPALVKLKAMLLSVLGAVLPLSGRPGSSLFLREEQRGIRCCAKGSPGLT